MAIITKQERTMMKKYPRLMISALSSGSGKTYITCGLLTLLARKGIDVRSFKCGPDYIDPMFHRAVLQVPSNNLDPYFADKDTVRELFMESASQDLSLIEGAMGYFDGLGGTQIKGSASELASMLDAPVVLVVNCKGLGRTVCALLKGMLEYEKTEGKTLIQGVILNRMSGMLFPAMKKQIEEELPVKVLGYLPEQKDFSLESRHLGLKLPEEIVDLQEKMEALADRLEKTIDVEALIELAEEAPELGVSKQAPDMVVSQEKSGHNNQGPRSRARCENGSQTRCRIGVARDWAFCLCYEDNLSLLEKNGAEIVPFSPLEDKGLPEVDGLLIGGGYPELFAQELSNNKEMRNAIYQAAKEGMPILAECGGFMYLQETLKDGQNQPWNMVGALPGECYNTGCLGRFGYVELTLPNGMKIKGHEFHYFDSTENGNYAQAKKPVGDKEWECMVRYKGILAGFPHLYYPSCPQFVSDFVEQCVQWRISSGVK